MTYYMSEIHPGNVTWVYKYIPTFSANLVLSKKITLSCGRNYTPDFTCVLKSPFQIFTCVHAADTVVRIRTH